MCFSSFVLLQVWFVFYMLRILCVELPIVWIYHTLTASLTIHIQVFLFLFLLDKYLGVNLLGFNISVCFVL